MNPGYLYAFAAYLVWGLLPVYWKWLQQVPTVQVIGHRIVWSFILLLLYIIATRQWKKFHSEINRRVFIIYGIAGILLSVNWLVYVWAVNAGFIVETSLGYFINPLLSVVLGMVFLGERLRPLQWLPIGLAAAGVVYLTLAHGSLPWIALTLAFTFGFYSLVKKVAPLGSLHGLTLETGFVFLPALGYLALIESTGRGAFGHLSLPTDGFLAGAGIITVIPLLLFASAARRIPLTMIGIMQYIAPTLQFLIGVFLYKEPFTPARLIGFSLVWAALLIFWLESVLVRRRELTRYRSVMLSD